MFVVWTWAPPPSWHDRWRLEGNGAFGRKYIQWLKNFKWRHGDWHASAGDTWCWTNSKIYQDINEENTHTRLFDCKMWTGTPVPFNVTMWDTHTELGKKKVCIPLFWSGNKRKTKCRFSTIFNANSPSTTFSSEIMDPCITFSIGMKTFAY